MLPRCLFVQPMENMGQVKLILSSYHMTLCNCQTWRPMPPGNWTEYKTDPKHILLDYVWPESCLDNYNVLAKMAYWGSIICLFPHIMHSILTLKPSITLIATVLQQIIAIASSEISEFCCETLIDQSQWLCCNTELLSVAGVMYDTVATTFTNHTWGCCKLGVW